MAERGASQRFAGGASNVPGDEAPPGDPFAGRFVQLYEEAFEGLFRYAMGLAGERQVAQDAVQECFLRLYIALREGECIRSERAWLHRVLRNLLFDVKRLARPEGGMGIEDAAQVPDRRQDPEARYRGAELMQTVASLLTPRELECFQLWTEGLRYEEIAGVLGIRPGTVGALLAKAVKKTRAVLLHERMWQCSKT